MLHKNNSVPSLDIISNKSITKFSVYDSKKPNKEDTTYIEEETENDIFVTNRVDNFKFHGGKPQSK
jgi:hypothetical protein